MLPASTAESSTSGLLQRRSLPAALISDASFYNMVHSLAQLLPHVKWESESTKLVRGWLPAAKLPVDKPRQASCPPALRIMIRRLYRSHHLSDCDLVFIREEQPVPTTAQDAESCKREPAHQIVIGEKSGTFLTEIDTEVGKGSTVQLDGKKCIFVQV